MTGNNNSNYNDQQRSGNKQNNNRNNRKGENNNRNSVQLINNITREGGNSELNDAVGMKIETFHQKIPFETFKDNIINYVISNYKNGGYTNPIFKKLEDHIKAMTIKHNSIPLGNTGDQTEKDIQREQVKYFISREYMLRSNMENCTIFNGDNTVQHYKPP